MSKLSKFYSRQPRKIHMAPPPEQARATFCGFHGSGYKTTGKAAEVDCKICKGMLRKAGRKTTPPKRSQLKLWPKAMRCLVATDYWSDDHTPYSYMLHEEKTDEAVRATHILDKLCQEAGVVDGDEIEIEVRRTGKRPFGDRKVRRVKAHTYKREAS